MVRLLGLARSTRNDPEIFAGLVHACRYCGLLEASEAAHREARRLDPHISTSVVYTWWAPGDMAKVLAETSDAGDSELRTMALEALGRQDEARKSLHATPAAALVPVWASIVRALLALVDRSPDAAAAFAELAATHMDPEALFMYAACQARVGDTAGAHSTLVASVEGRAVVADRVEEVVARLGLGPDALSSTTGWRLPASARVELGSSLYMCPDSTPW